MTWLGLVLLISSPNIDAELEYQQGLAHRDNSVLARSHFRRSGQAFDQTWEDETRTRSTALGRAQAWFLAGEMGRSVAAYREGLQEFPDDQDLLNGLDFVREQVLANASSEMLASCQHSINSTADISRPYFWGLSILCLSLFASWQLIRSRFGQELRTFAIALGLWGTTFVIAYLWNNSLERNAEFWNQPLAVVAERTTLHAGNSLEYPSRFTQPIPAGVEVKPVHQRGAWWRVELADGSSGWLPSDRLIIVNKKPQ